MSAQKPSDAIHDIIKDLQDRTTEQAYENLRLKAQLAATEEELSGSRQANAKLRRTVDNLLHAEPKPVVDEMYDELSQLCKSEAAEKFRLIDELDAIASIIGDELDLPCDSATHREILRRRLRVLKAKAEDTSTSATLTAKYWEQIPEADRRLILQPLARLVRTDFPHDWEYARILQLQAIADFLDRCVDGVRPWGAAEDLLSELGLLVPAQAKPATDKQGVQVLEEPISIKIKNNHDQENRKTDS